MSFREKSAWIMFATVLVAAAVFFSAIASGRFEGLERLHFLFAVVLAMIVAQIALHIVAAVMNPADAQSPKDEREKSIEVRSLAVGYYVLAVAVMGMFFTGHATLSASAVLYHALIALVAATLAIYLTQIVLFRIGR